MEDSTAPPTRPLAKALILLLMALSVSIFFLISPTAAGLDDSRENGPAALQTRVFQQGLDGYAGVEDTWISTNDWDSPPQHTVNYGRNEALNLERDDGDNPLLRFDLSSIPANSAVLTATLTLYNTTGSSFSGTQDFPRRVRAFQVLRDWDEGNQVQSPIDGAGKHGATGDQAFDYFPGEGIDDPWTARGMAAGVDYVETAESYADVVNAGWYSWTITSLARTWVRGEVPNDGLVLRDASGYADDHRDWRTFVSSQSISETLRPRLTIIYDPATPNADAGADRENLQWAGGPVTLDGSGSHDRPGGNDATLSYQWRILEAAFGSDLASGDLVGADQVAAFQPDVPGQWQLELTVSNDVGSSAKDSVAVRLLSIPASHPRIHLSAGKLAALQARARPDNARWTQLVAEADDGGMAAAALVGLVSGQSSYCDAAIGEAENLIADPNDWSTKAGDVALIFDWCYDQLSPAQRTAFVDYFNAWGDDTPKSEDTPGWGNYWPRYSYSYALIGLASYGDNPRASEWLDEYRQRRFAGNDLALLDFIAAGGAWPEGMIYDWIANWPRMKALDAWQTATGENLFASSGWFRERLGYLLLHRWPGLAEQWGYDYHPYLSTGDTERNRGSMANYGRIMALILIEQFPDEPPAQQLQAYLAAPPADRSMDFLAHEEFLWFDPGQASQPPGRRTHYAEATGTIFMRSGWPDAAADSDPSPTFLTFQSGDHFTYHQHYDQNSFTLFKFDDLALDSGVYSGDGLSEHDRNYYVRTIAHNTLLVYNPDENFEHARPDAVSNDGGQRSVYPASRSPQTVEYFQQHAAHYDTGDMLRFEDSPAYTYALGDATNAYNNPAYNQAMDTWLADNTAKVSRFQREFLYLRPLEINNSQFTVHNSPFPNDYVVLFDRVGVTDPAFSGENTKLLFHLFEEPVISGGTATSISPGETLHENPVMATAINGNGKLFIRPLLPLQRNLRVVGGRGQKAFWVFDANYDWQWDSDEAQPRPINDFEDTPYGEWRIELEPADSALAHNFLTILHPAISTTVTAPATTLISATQVAGVHIADPALNRLALFSAAEDGSPPAGPLVYSYTPTTGTLNLLFDLAPRASYELSAALDGGVQTVMLTPVVRRQAGAGTEALPLLTASDQGVLSFTLAAAGSLLPDFNGNGCMDVGDILTVAARWGQATTDARFDRDGDGWVSVVDVMRVATLWDAGCTAPAQATATPTPTATSTPTPTATPTATPAGQPSPTATATPSPTPTATPTAPAGSSGHITYQLWDGHVYRLAAEPGATPEDVTAGLDSLAAGSVDEGLNIAPDGSWLVLISDRFDPDCVGWECLSVVSGDLSAGDVMRQAGGEPPRGEWAAIASGGNLVIFQGGDGPHEQDLWRSERADSNSPWSAPALLTAASPFQYNEQPAISANGAKVVLHCDDEPYAQAGAAICEVGADGSSFRVVIAPLDGPPGSAAQDNLRHPDYAPDGSIVFEADWGDNEQIWRLLAGGGDPQLISDQFANDNSPCVLPDGRIVSLWLDRPGGSGDHELKVMAADGSSYFMALSDVDVADVGVGCGE